MFALISLLAGQVGKSGILMANVIDMLADQNLLISFYSVVKIYFMALSYALLSDLSKKL